MWTSLGGRRVSFPVARHGHTELDTGMLHLIMRPAILGCLEHGFDVAAITFDGAAINRAYGVDVCSLPASTWFDEEDLASYPSIDFEFKVAMLHPYHGRLRPIFLIWDPPHWIKKLRNFLYSSNPGDRTYDNYTEMPADGKADGKIPKEGPHLTPLPEHPVSAAALVVRLADGPTESCDGVLSITGMKLHEATSALEEHGGKVCKMYERYAVPCSATEFDSSLNSKAVQMGDPLGLVGAIGGHKAGKSYVYYRLGDTTHIQLPVCNLHAALEAADHKLGGTLFGVAGQYLDLRSEVQPAPTDKPTGQFLSRYWPVNLTMIQRGVGRGSGVLVSYTNELTVNKFTKDMFELDRSAKMNVGKASIVFSRKAQTAIKFSGGNGHLGTAGKPPSRLPEYRGYGGLLELQNHVNDMWDICNCSIKKDDKAQSKNPIYDPVNDPQIAALLGHLNFFQGWHDRLERCPELTPAQRASSFPPKETWLETQGICLGMVALAREYVRPAATAGGSPPPGRLVCVTLSRITSDPCENHASLPPPLLLLVHPHAWMLCASSLLT